MDIKDFKYKTTLHVRFNEIDMLGVCNNAVYISYFEHARLQYIKHVGLEPKEGLFSDGKLYFIVRNEVDYLSHAYYNDELNIYTRVSYIKNSSYGFEHIVENNLTKEIIAEGKGVVVHVDPETHKSTPIESDFINIITSFEDKVEIIK